MKKLFARRLAWWLVLPLAAPLAAPRVTATFLTAAERACVAARRALRPCSSHPTLDERGGVRPAAAPDATAFGQLFNIPPRER